MKWWSEYVNMPDFTDFQTGVEWAETNILSHLLLLEYKKNHVPVTKSVKNYFKK